MNDLPFKRLAILSNQAFSLVNFRGELIQALVQKGIQVYALAPDFDDDLTGRITELGAIPIQYSLHRTGMNPFRDVLDFTGLIRQLRSLKVDAVFSYSIKPVIYGGLASKLVGIPIRYSMIEGAGYIYSDQKEGSYQRRLLRKLVTFLYKGALHFSRNVYVLNEEDYNLLLNEGVADKNQLVLIHGIGVNLKHFTPLPIPSQPITFMMIARLLKEKGVHDFVEAARIIKRKYPQAHFICVGGLEESPDAVKQEEMEEWIRAGLIEWSGHHVSDVRRWIERSSVFVLPSYYREGVPRSIQEAMACGRPIITTDWVGCRDTVDEGVNGFLVPIRQPEALAQVMEKFIQQPELLKKMGDESRRLSEARYDVEKINALLISTL